MRKWEKGKGGRAMGRGEREPWGIWMYSFSILLLFLVVLFCSYHRYQYSWYFVIYLLLRLLFLTLMSLLLLQPIALKSTANALSFSVGEKARSYVVNIFSWKSVSLPSCAGICGWVRILREWRACVRGNENPFFVNLFLTLLRIYKFAGTSRWHTREDAHILMHMRRDRYSKCGDVERKREKEGRSEGEG